MSTRRKAKAARFYQPPNKARPSTGPSEVQQLVEIEMMELKVQAFDVLHQPLQQVGVYDMDSQSDKLRLAKRLWTADFSEASLELREANSTLVTLLEHQITNTYIDGSAEQKKMLIDGILMCISRAQSQKKITLMGAALTVLAKTNQISDEFWRNLSLWFKPLASETWTNGILEIAATCRPPEKYEVLPGVFVAVFDNLTMQCNYGSITRREQTGIRLDMTNWISTSVPKILSPNLDALDACARMPACPPPPFPPALPQINLKSSRGRLQKLPPPPILVRHNVRVVLRKQTDEGAQGEIVAEDAFLPCHANHDLISD